MYGLNNEIPVRINKLRWNHGGFPRFMGTSNSISYNLNNDTFKKLFGKKEFPHYTRPRNFEWLEVPKELLNWNHKEIENWKKNNLK